MKIPQEFDTIRPWEPEDLPEVFDRLLANDQFKQVLAYLYPQVPLEMIAQKLKACKTNLDFQLAFAYDFVHGILKKATTGCEMDCSSLDNTRNYTFISNHRDIVLDSAILDVMLIENKFKTTCEIAIGDNLLSLPWVKDLVRVNKAFIVERALSMRQMLMSSKRLSDYMHFAIKEKNENIWIAQREGRAKDSNDRTQKSILQMMSMGGEGSIIERLKQLHLVPLSISYEYDPCDFLKAKEFQQKRDYAEWKKGPTDDLVSMQTGIFGYKGHVHYHAAPCLDEYLDSLDPDMPKQDIYNKVAAYIDQQIHRNYRLYPGNYVALDMLEETEACTDQYTAEDKAKFEKYIQGQLAKIDLPNKDEAYLKERLLTMYANPVRNNLAAQ
uniref:1-acyl-sn-glycerol-3-phosphate acyltransferase n=1 Tax=Segatella hominis TaxID=2518605 RepID=UPI004038C327